MGEIATSNQQITLFYSSDSVRAKQALAYAKAEGLLIQPIDILKTPLTGTQIVELAKRLGLEVKDLVNQDRPAYAKKFETHELSTDDWIKLTQHNPEIMKRAITNFDTQ